MNHKDLDVWKRSMDLTVRCHEITRSFPREELYGLTSQIRRAASSIPANIAEGAGRQGAKEFAHFLSIARGSCSELETHLILAKRLGYLDEKSCHEAMSTLVEVMRLLGGTIRAQRRRV